MSYSVVLTGASFIHKDYLKMFNETVPLEIHEMIDGKMNCEDLAMNVMVGYLQSSGRSSADIIEHVTCIRFCGSIHYIKHRVTVIMIT